MSPMRKNVLVLCGLLSTIVCAEQTAEARKVAAEREQQRASLMQIQDSLRREREARDAKKQAVRSAVPKPPPQPDFSFLTNVPPATILNSGYPVGTTLERKTDTFISSDDPKARNVIIYLPCRSADAQDGEHVGFFWRPFLITPDGRIKAIGPEMKIGTSVYTDQG